MVFAFSFPKGLYFQKMGMANINFIGLSILWVLGYIWHYFGATEKCPSRDGQLTIFSTQPQITGQFWQNEVQKSHWWKSSMSDRVTGNAIAKESRVEEYKQTRLEHMWHNLNSHWEKFEVQIFCMQEVRSIEIQVLDLLMSVVSKGYWHEKLWMTITLDISSYQVLSSKHLLILWL